jgi:ABC-type antimicrobial peptide transport system permease subunit
MLVGIVMSASIVIELLLALSGGLGPLTIDRLQKAGIVGRLLLGVPPEAPAAAWGGMLADGINVGARAPWLIVLPAGALVVTATGLVLLASGLVDLLKLRARQREHRNQTSETAILS